MGKFWQPFLKLWSPFNHILLDYISKYRFIIRHKPIQSPYNLWTNFIRMNIFNPIFIRIEMVKIFLFFNWNTEIESRDYLKRLLLHKWLFSTVIIIFCMEFWFWRINIKVPFLWMRQCLGQKKLEKTLGS